MEEIAKLIDHTTLGSDVDVKKVEKLCEEARQYGFKSVFVQPCRAELAVGVMRGTGIHVGTVSGFPFGANNTRIKVDEAALAVTQGVDELDMVINVGWIKDGRWKAVETDISEVVNACRAAGSGREIVVKVIIETCLLTDDEKHRAATVVREAGADFVKTSTGYMAAGANVEDVALLRAVVGPDFGVKASGGIRTLEQMKALIEAGANRIGTSAGVAIMHEYA